jgi:hypothetical protein
MPKARRYIGQAHSLDQLIWSTAEYRSDSPALAPILPLPLASAVSANGFAFGDSALFALGNKVALFLNITKDAIPHHLFSKSFQ